MKPLTNIERVCDGAIWTAVGIGGLGRVDDSRGEVLLDADVHRALHELWRIIILIQNRDKDCRRAREGVQPTVSTLDCEKHTKRKIGP